MLNTINFVEWLRHTNHNMTHDIYTCVFCTRCWPYLVRCRELLQRLSSIRNKFIFIIIIEQAQKAMYRILRKSNNLCLPRWYITFF